MEITTTAFIFYKGKLLLVFKKDMNKWMHVGGHVEANESFDEALLREIKEEVNLDVEVIDFYDGLPIKSAAANVYPQKMPFLMHAVKQNGKIRMRIDYIAIAKEPVNMVLQDDELADYKWVSEKELAKIDSPEVLKQLASKAFKEIKKRNLV